MTVFTLGEKERRRQQEIQGRIYVESASEALYRCRLQCEEDGVPFPPDLEKASRLLRRHLGREEGV